MPKLSIIVPIYNSEDTLDKTITSILRQTIKNIEIILVNDGSTDNSLIICEKYREKDNRVKVLDKKNEGVSSARNSGLSLATGDFIGFVDSDDWIEKEMFESMYNDLIKTDADISFCNYYNGSRKIEIQVHNNLLRTYDIFNQLIKNIVGPTNKNTLIMGSVCRCLFKKETINNLNFNEKTPYMEDTLFIVEALLRSEKVIINPNFYYHYRNNEKSAMRNYKNSFFEIGKNVYKKILDLFIEYGSLDSIRDNLKMRYLELILSAVRNEVHENNPQGYNQRIENIKLIIEDNTFQSYLKSYDYKHLKAQKKISLFLIKRKCYLVLYYYQKILAKLVEFKIR